MAMRLSALFAMCSIRSAADAAVNAAVELIFALRAAAALQLHLKA